MVMFLSDAVAVLESVGSVNVCVLIEGTLLSRNVTVSIHGSGPHIGKVWLLLESGSYIRSHLHIWLFS